MTITKNNVVIAEYNVSIAKNNVVLAETDLIIAQKDLTIANFEFKNIKTQLGAQEERDEGQHILKGET